jgi:glycine oxidase
MSARPRVTIAGAGALGLSTALTLADAGCAVTVCDPGGANASSVAAGMLAPVFEAVLDAAARPHFDLMLAARNEWPALAARTGIALDRTGAVAVGGLDWLAEVAASLTALGLHPSEIPARAARALAPGLSEALGPALLTREDWRIEAQAALAALRAAAADAGVAFRAQPLDGSGDAEFLVIATGAGAGLAGVAPELVRLSPIKGHIVRFDAPASGASVRTRGVYAAPGQGVIAVGATMEAGRADAAVDDAVAAPFVAAGAELFPALREAPYRVMAGVRAATPDGLPLVGRSAAPGVLLAVGARRNGWLLAPLVAKVVAAYVTGRDTGRYAAQFDPRRFEGEGA